jgi:hypothetical protein
MWDPPVRSEELTSDADAAWDRSLGVGSSAPTVDGADDETVILAAGESVRVLPCAPKAMLSWIPTPAEERADVNSVRPSSRALW